MKIWILECFIVNIDITKWIWIQNPEESNDLHDILKTTEKPLNALKEAELCPGNKVLQDINAGFR